jgi:hypothetical protein
VGAVLTTYKRSAIGRTAGVVLYHWLSEGLRLGEAGLRLNLMCGDAPWLLLGDPAAAIGLDCATTRVGVDHSATVTLSPGEMYLLESSRSEVLFTVEPHDDSSISGRELLLVPMPNSGAVLALYVGSQPVAVEVTAHGDRKPRDYLVLSSLRDLRGPMLFAEQLAQRSRMLGTTGDDGVSQSVGLEATRRLSSTLADIPASELLQLHHGAAEDLQQRARMEEHAWLRFNENLCQLLAAFVRGRPSVELTSNNLWSAERGRVVTSDRPCEYCDALLDATAWRRLSLCHRRVTYCAGCGLIQDTTEGFEGAWLRGSTRVRAGARLPIALHLSYCRPVNGWRCYRAQLFLDGRSNPEPAPIFGLVGEVKDLVDLDMHVEVPAELTAGVHYVVAAVAAHGDCLIVRRPIMVLPAG